MTCTPLPDWPSAVAWDSGFRGRSDEPFSYLLLSEQYHARRHLYHRHTAVRLETMQAVQHLSQWQLAFDPATQHVELHHVRILRDGQATEHARPDKLRLLQRESGLESFVVDGSATLLIVLEDVRPGDVIESAYTIATTPRLFGEHHSAFFSLSPSLSVG